MPLTTKVGSFNITTGSAGSTVAVTDVGFEPGLIFFWWGGRVETAETDSQSEKDIQAGFGIARSATARICTATQSDHGNTVTNCDNVNRDTACIASLTVTGTEDGSADLSSMDSGGFTLVIDDAFATNLRIIYLALGGSDITNVFIGSFAASTPSDQDITAAGFQPDLVFFLNGDGFSAVNTIDTWLGLSIGVAAGYNGATPTNSSLYIGGEGDGLTTSDTWSYCLEGESITMTAGGPALIGLRGSVSTWLSTGFRVTWAETDSIGRNILYCAIKGVKAITGNLLTQTDTTTDIVETSFGFQPAAVMFFSHNKVQSTANTSQAHAELSIGAATSATDERAACVLDKDAAGTMDCGVAHEYDSCYINQSTAAGIATEGLMHVTSWDSDGFTCRMTDADPAQSFVWYLAFDSIEAAGAGVKRLTTLGVGWLAPLFPAWWRYLRMKGRRWI